MFLSTAEPTYPNGASKNPTKTPCSQHVFNTALTRAKSLVVCAGNPFLLMKIEKMTKKVDSDKFFWAQYIKRCIENETFIVPSVLGLSNEYRYEKLSKLRELVFTTEGHTKSVNPSSKKLDSITNAYKKAFENLPSLKRCRIKLEPIMGSMQWQMKEEGANVEKKEHSQSSSKVQPNDLPEGTFLCNLEIVDYRKALGHPLEASKPVVTMYGLGNRKGAFDGDLVVVKLNKTSEATKKSYGEVIDVVQKCHPDRFVCRVDRYSTIHFTPIDRKTPTFVNLPMISRDLTKLRKKDIEAGLTTQHQWVVIFEESSLPLSGEDNLPRIKEIVPAEIANRLLFVVHEIGWNPKYRLPLGAVVESLPLGTNFFHAERLLRASYSIDEDKWDKGDGGKIENDEEEMSRPVPPNVICQAFTIDPSDARNLDDALSLVRDQENDGTYTLSVLIPNVGRQLEQGSLYDSRAQARGTSVYGIYRSMLPDAVCRKFSLTPNKVRDVLIVSTKVTVGQDGTVDVEVSNSLIKGGKMQSQVRLNYYTAQCLLNDDLSNLQKELTRLSQLNDEFSNLQEDIRQYPSVAGQPDLSETLKLLYKIAMHLRVKRLGRAAYAYDLSEEDDKTSWQAHLLVAELMIWANKTVAEYVHANLPSFAVLRRQASLNGEELNQLAEKFAGVIKHSVVLSALEKGDSTELRPLLIPHSTVKQLQEAVKNRDFFCLQQLLTSSHLYPQLAEATIHLRTISQRAEYVCSNSFYQLIDTANASSPFRHHSLSLDYYTHFTSPIRRFCDVVVQRLLNSVLEETEPPYRSTELEDFCHTINIRSREAKLCQDGMSQLELAQKFGESCDETQAYVHRKKNRLVVSFSELKYQSCLKKRNEFRISDLVCLEDKSGFLEWKATIFSFKGNDFILQSPKLCEFKEVTSQKEDKSKERSAPEKALSSATESESNDLSTVAMTVFYRVKGRAVPIINLPLDKSSSDSNVNPDESSSDEELNIFDKMFTYQLSSTLTQDGISVDAERWQNVIQEVDNLSDNTVAQLLDIIPKPQLLSQNNSYDSVEVQHFRTSPILKYEVRRKLGSNSIIPVWLGQTLLREPILTPCLQLMEVAPELRICLQHNKYPAECFSDPVLFNASKAVYESLDVYVTLWEKVFLAEVAQDSVLDRKKPLTILKDVPLEWPELKIPENSLDHHYQPGGLITLEIPPKSQSFLQYNVSIDVGDLVCVRYDLKDGRTGQQYKSVYHLVVSEKYSLDTPSEERKWKKKKHKGKNKSSLSPIIVKMKHIGTSSCKVSPKMAGMLRKRPFPTCELQVIHLQESYK